MPLRLVAEAKPFEEYKSLKGFALIKLHYIVCSFIKKKICSVSGVEVTC